VGFYIQENLYCRTCEFNQRRQIIRSFIALLGAISHVSGHASRGFAVARFLGPEETGDPLLHNPLTYLAS